jgi:hypothetical protein
MRIWKQRKGQVPALPFIVSILVQLTDLLLEQLQFL